MRRPEPRPIGKRQRQTGTSQLVRALAGTLIFAAGCGGGAPPAVPATEPQQLQYIEETDGGDWDELSRDDQVALARAFLRDRKLVYFGIKPDELVGYAATYDENEFGSIEELLAASALILSEPAPPEPQPPPPAPPPPPPGYVSRAQLGAAWPFSVAAGVVRCELGGAVVFRANGVDYAINGTARGLDRWAEVDDIWLDDPSIPGTKKDISPILDRGLQLCD